MRAFPGRITSAIIPVRPANIAQESITLLNEFSIGVIPFESPVVLNAETVSKIMSEMVNVPAFNAYCSEKHREIVTKSRMHKAFTVIPIALSTELCEISRPISDISPLSSELRKP